MSVQYIVPISFLKNLNEIHETIFVPYLSDIFRHEYVQLIRVNFVNYNFKLLLMTTD